MAIKGDEPVFSNDIDKEMDSKTRKIVLETLTEKDEERKKLSVKEKIDAIRKTAEASTKKIALETEHLHSHGNEIDCPGCKGHTLKVDGDSAKCTGDKCGKEFLLEEVNPARRDYICTTCGGTVTKDKATSLKGDKTCPHCKKGKDVIEIDWKSIDEIMKQKKGLKKVDVK